MEIKLKYIKVRDLIEGFESHPINGVKGYGGKLDIRPPYQREFVYSTKQQEAVIDTVLKGYPLNVMYWADNGEGGFEVIDGQQRTLSICNYIKDGFSYGNFFFKNLPNDKQAKILDYELTVYICSGTESQKLEWFKTINIAGEELTQQELRNAVYVGTWLKDAKEKFSKPACPAYKIANRYIKGTLIRQDYLETAIKWISKNRVEEYMSDNQNKPTANELWLYFASVINWIETVFPVYRKEMKGIQWGLLYNEFKNVAESYDEEVKELMADEDVTNKRGIYTYLLTRDEKHLNIRSFDKRMRREAYENQNGICPMCEEGENEYKLEEMEADHIIPWSQGGTTTRDNLRMLCRKHNREKSNK